MSRVQPCRMSASFAIFAPAAQSMATVSRWQLFRRKLGAESSPAIRLEILRKWSSDGAARIPNLRNYPARGCDRGDAPVDVASSRSVRFREAAGDGSFWLPASAAADGPHSGGFVRSL